MSVQSIQMGKIALDEGSVSVNFFLPTGPGLLLFMHSHFEFDIDYK